MSRRPLTQSLLALILSALAANASAAAQPIGEYVLGDRGTILATFDGAGNFSGVAALPNFGIVDITGNAPVSDDGSITGAFTLFNRFTSEPLFTSTLQGSAASNLSTVLLRLNTTNPQSFKGGVRTGREPVPGGRYFGTFLPTSLLIHFNRAQNRQLVTIQGDQDFGLDLTQAVGGHLLFNASGNGYGVIYENGDSSSSPRFATAHYDARHDKVSLTFFASLFGGEKKTVRLSGAVSDGSYDGVYSLFAAAGSPSATVVATVTVLNGVLTGTNTNFGAISGTVNDAGVVSFTSERLTVPAGSSQSGPHNAVVSYNGTTSANPIFPEVFNGTFTGTGVSGTFTLEQLTGITGATIPGGVPRAETWTGVMNGEHDSPIVAGGIYGESYSLSMNFDSSLISALRGKSEILTGSGTLSGEETVQTQAPFATSISNIVASTVNASFDITYAGVLTNAGPSIEFSSPTALIPGLANILTGPDAGTQKSENRRILKLRISSMTATVIKGAWADGKFILRKQ